MNIKEIDNYLLYLLVILFPLFSYSNILFIVCSITLILIIKTIKIAFTGKISLSIGNFDIPIIILTASYLLSTIFVSSNKMGALVNPGATSMIIVGATIYFLSNQVGVKNRKFINYSMIISVTIYSVLTLLSATKVISWFLPGTNYFANILYITPILLISLSNILKQKELTFKFLIGVTLFVSLFALSLSIFYILPNKLNSPKYLSFKESTTIAIGALKSNPLFGIGPSNYIEAFNKYRSFEFNKKDIWNNKFNQGSSFFITNLTETGIVGSLSFLALVAIFVNFLITKLKEEKVTKSRLVDLSELSAPLVALINLLFFPSFPIAIFIVFIFLGTISDEKRQSYVIPSKVASIFIVIPTLIVIFAASYKAYTIVAAEILYNSALKDLSANKAKETYTKLKKTITLNSKVDRYHKALSSVNFGIANSLSKKENLTESDKEQATLFIQESINEAKATVSLNINSAENWEFLGKTYYLLIPFAKGSDQFALESYKQAIALDPINPNLRIELGKIYMIQKKYKEAIETFKLAILAKEDHPNAHFNLGLAYKENGDINNAKIELKKTLSLLNSGSNDYQIASKELENVNNPTQVEPAPSPLPVVLEEPPIPPTVDETEPINTPAPEE